MKALAVILFLLMGSTVFAEDVQVYKDYTKDYGSYYEKPDNSGRMQENTDYHWKPGSYLKDDGSGRLNQYDNFVPTPGSYFDKSGQRYEDFVPIYGDRLEEK